MGSLYLAAGLAVLTAAGHSYLSERIFLRPLREQPPQGHVWSSGAARRLATGMCHLVSLAWIGMAASLLWLEPASGGYAATLHVIAAFFAISGLCNFWVVGRPHFGGVMLLSASGLTLIALHG